MAALHDEFLALRRLLVSTDSDVRDDPGTHATELSQISSIVHRRRLLQEVLQTEPPQDIHWASYLSQPAAVMHMKTLSVAYFCIVLLCKMARDLDRPKLCPFDASFFLSAFAWADFLTPMRDEDMELLLLSDDVLDVLTTTFTEGALSFSQGFVQYLPKPRMLEVLLSSGQRVTTLIVDAWFHWSKTLDLDHPNQAAIWCNIQSCINAVPMFFLGVDSDIFRDILAAEILRAAGGESRRFFRHHNRLLHFLLDSSRPDKQLSIINLLHVLRPIAARVYPNYGTRGALPSSAIASTMDVLQHYALTEPMSPAWHSAWKILPDMCMASEHTVLAAVAQGLFVCLVRIRLVNPRAERLDRIFGLFLLSETLKSARAVRGFHTTYAAFKESQPTVQLTDREKEIVSVFEIRFASIEAADAAWEQVNTCCNANCTTEDNGERSLRACICGDALYCSKGCQRAHWNEGGHKSECLSTKGPVSGTASELNLEISKVRGIIEDGYHRMQSMRMSRGAPMWLSMDQTGTTPTLTIIPFHAQKREGVIAHADVVIDVSYKDDDGAVQTRRLQFVPEAWAGHIRMPFRLLTQTYFKAKVTNSPAPLPGLSKRERLFGRH
ncbi:hypothetical protein FB107DRAFT_279060 [Schizophyllum commune]